MALPPNPHPRPYNVQALRADLIEGTATQGFGPTGFETFHDGVDIVLPNAAQWHGHPPVHAPISGTVVFSGWDNPDPTKGYGQKVAIANPQGYTTWVGHLYDRYQIATPDRTDYNSEVEVGQQVYAGDTIGHEGSTGWSTGNHVHYGIHHGSQRIDPSLGEPAFAGVGPHSYPTVTNVWYALYHDMGLGAGDNTNAQKWAGGPPTPGTVESPIQTMSNGQLLRNTGNHDVDPIPPGEPGTDPGGGGGNPVGSPGCTQGDTVAPNADGSCPIGYTYVAQVGGGLPGIPAGECVCTASLQGGGGLFGNIGQTVQQAITTIGVVLVGLVFITAGLIALTREGPVNAVTEPAITGTKALVKTGAKIGALAA